VNNPTTGGTLDIGKVAAGAVYVGVAGGTASVLGGGKFSNGAYAASFAYLVNGVATAQRIGIAGLRISSWACRFGPLPCGAALGATAVGATAGLLYNESSDGGVEDKPADNPPERKINPSKQDSPVWNDLDRAKDGLRTSGSGSKQRYYDWDYTHGDIEVYDRNGRHLGSMEPTTGEMYKPPVPGRRIDKP
jgi:hypothetical protein